MSDFTCNLLIMGQTGTGKSSLLNYVFGTDFEARAGRPVTGQGIYEQDAIAANQKIRVFDSWGLEPGKLEEWQELIENTLKKHGADKPMEEWFHTVIYCIQAGSARVQEIDIEIVKKFIEEGYRVSIILTKADQLNNDEIEIMKKTIIDNLDISDNRNIYNNSIEIIPACATEKTFRDGTKVVPFGKDKIVQLIIDNWRKNVINIMPAHIIKRIEAEIDKWQYAEIDNIDKMDISGYDWGKGHNKFKQDVSDRAKEFFEKLANETLPMFIKDDLDNCQKIDILLKDISAPDICVFIPEYYNKTNAAWNIVGEIIANLALVPFIVKCIMAFNNDCIDKEKSKLESVVSNIAVHMKQGFIVKKNDIAQYIAAALGM